MKLFPNPNLTIIVPGGCNSSCPFCFWRSDSKGPGRDYLQRVKHVLDNLPGDFWQISLSGGEPIISKYTNRILNIIDKRRWQKVVLTTNGTGCEMFNPSLFRPINIAKIDHVNISRHDISTAKNRAVFHNNQIPSLLELYIICQNLNKMGIDVTMNCVLYKKKPEDIIPFIRMAKKVGASKCCFRKIHDVASTLDPSDCEIHFMNYIPIDTFSCPVCASKTQIIEGMPVVWKRSVFEPSEVMDDIYELILQADGTLTSDWAGKQEVQVKKGCLTRIVR